MKRTGNVRVAFRVRPLFREEQLEDQNGCFLVDKQKAKVSVRHDGGTHQFGFDQVYDEDSLQSEIYRDMVSSLVPDFVAGRNCCVIVYGERCSGKTHTLLGKSAADYLDEHDDERSGVSSLGSAGVSHQPRTFSRGGQEADESLLIPPDQIVSQGEAKYSTLKRRSDHSKEADVGGLGALHEMTRNSGITPRVVQEIFDIFRRRRRRSSSGTGGAGGEEQLKLSFMEVYNERIVDLLGLDISETDEHHSLQITRDEDQGIIVEGAIEVKCRHESDVSTAIGNAIRNRRKREVNLGIDSSRSHAVVILKVERYSKSRGKHVTSNFFLVDLANSALVRKPPSDAHPQTIQEFKSVKRSLGALRKCLRSLALSNRSPNPPHDESTLTNLLQNVLTKGSGISLIVTANPLLDSATESLSAIRYGVYIGGLGGDEKDEAARKSPSTGSEPRRRSIESLPSKRQEESKSVYSELEEARDLLKHLPLDDTEDDNRSGSDPADLVAALLNSAAKKIEAHLLEAKKELKLSGFDASTSVDEMEQKLFDVTKNLKSMKFDGNLTFRVRNDLQAAQEELQRLSVGMEEGLRDSLRFRTSSAPRSNDGENTRLYDAQNGTLQDRSSAHSDPSSFQREHENANLEKRRADLDETNLKKQVERLTQELAEMKNANKALHRQQEERGKELSEAKKRIKELEESVLDDKSWHSTAEATMVGTVLGDVAITNTVGHNAHLLRTKGKIDDWDEAPLDIGPSPVSVCLRLRPMTKLERNRRSRSCIEVHEGGREFTVDSPLDGEYDFCFDHVFDVSSTQEEVFEEVGMPIVDHLLGGVNCAVIVYGLTGSGKSHTLAGKLPQMREDYDESENSEEGSVSSTPTVTEQDAGFSPRLVADLFRNMKDSPNTVEFRIFCSYVCIYLEKLFDLLDPRFDKKLVVRENSRGVYIEGAVEAFCFNEEDIINLIRRGSATRKLIANRLTMDHNRSHSILLLNIEQRHMLSGRVRRSCLQLVELAGFEVSSKAKGQSMQETKIIHKSFSALGNVIKMLSEGHSHAPYRESKLTSILKDALGGNCNTTLFITASPSSYNISETINAIRLGQRVRRVTNRPRVNIDASVDDYRFWLLHSEGKLGELTKHVKQLARELVEASKRDPVVSRSFSTPIWQSMIAIAEEEESKFNPCRMALILDEDNFMQPDQQMWRALTIELAKRVPSEKLASIRDECQRVQSILSDIQSESVVLRRQNELLVQEKRKKEEELADAHREIRRITMQYNEVEHRLDLAENRAKEAVVFLRYMRTLCWRLRKDVERDRPIDITEVTAHLHGAPDLSGLVDIDSMMVQSGLLHSKDMDIEKIEAEYFDYLQELGLIIDEDEVLSDEADELSGLDDGLGSGSSDARWRKVQARSDRIPEASIAGSDDSKVSHGNPEKFMGFALPWMQYKRENVADRPLDRAKSLTVARNTRRERELQRDLQNMANKCVELQMELNQQRELIDSLTHKASTLKMKQLSQEALSLAKERDRMMHNAKAATWKLQELHVVNKILSKQAVESKQQIQVLEEGFHRLQESFRATVQEGLDADRSLRDRVKVLQSVIDSLTGPPPNIDKHDEDDDDSLGSDNPLFANIHLPVRGRCEPKYSASLMLIDPSSPQSVRRCLLLHYQGKRRKKRPSALVHRKSKFARRSFKFGNALIGSEGKRLQRAFQAGRKLRPPIFLDDGDHRSMYSEEYVDDEE